MSHKANLRLLISTTMSNKQENRTIRFAKKARENLDLSRTTVTLGKGQCKISLTVKKAYKADANRLTSMVRSGKLSLDQARYLGFVSRSVYAQIAQKEGDNIWISDTIGDITIGADPEFGFVYTNPHTGDLLLKRGSQVLPKTGMFGSDGPGVEVRPKPDSNHLTVLQNISNLLRNPPEKAKAYRWLGGATFRDRHRTYWFGGHIHLGTPAALHNHDLQEVYRNTATMLDILLALPLVRFDTPEPHRRRNGCNYGYGKAGRGDTGGADASIRTNNPGRFEYRVLSGLWLTHPALARVVMGSAKAITESVYDRILDRKGSFSEGPCSTTKLLRNLGIGGARQLNSVINASKTDAITPDMLKKWKRLVLDLEKYDNYAPELEALIALTSAGPDAVKKGLCLDLKRNWAGKKALLPKATSRKLRDALEPVEEKGWE